MNKIEYLLEQLGSLPPEDRAMLDEKLIGMIASDAESNRQQYGFQLASDFIDEAKLLAKNWGKMSGISTGYQMLDDLTLGLVEGELTVVAGSTSNGKTALAVNITTKILEQDKSVLFVTLEMTKPQLTSRMMFVNENFENNAANLAYQKEDELNWKSIDGLIQQAARDMAVEVVVIDHLHYFTRELNSLAEDLGRITKELKKNAIRYNLPIILISHVRKVGKGEIATMEDLRGSSYIAQDADIVLMVNKPKDFPDQITVTCEKNRNRGIRGDGTAILDWDRTRITERWV